ncbi:MAG: spore cortex-lytic enzyme [Clostridia bacterium]|nr:spore cortex-lytic enzyme [Clostridia bacterium]
MERNKYLMRACAILAVLAFALSMAMLYPSRAATYRRGSSGSTVRNIQQRLKNWGYYTGAVDGIYGSRTVEAVKYFQRKNGLTADGVCGNATLRALGISTGISSAGAGRQDDLYLLAKMISAEARGEPYVGQVAVGAVILNRVRHPSFPNSIAGVLYQPGAFTALSDGQFRQEPGEESRRAAQDAMNGWDPTGGAIYYYNPAKSTSSWIFSRETIMTIGKHVFAK